jgi:hypothetical protein
MAINNPSIYMCRDVLTFSLHYIDTSLTLNPNPASFQEVPRNGSSGFLRYCTVSNRALHRSKNKQHSMPIPVTVVTASFVPALWIPRGVFVVWEDALLSPLPALASHDSASSKK